MSQYTYALVSLGCPKNVVDSERMAGVLAGGGYTMVPEAEGADFVVVNTCGFLASARSESYATIEEMIALKRQGKLRGIIVAGCLAEKEKDQILQRYPQVDQVVGLFARDEIARSAERLIARIDEQRTVFCPAPARPLSDRDRFRITPRHLAYLKISEGCDRQCAFCTIPSIRGRYFSKTVDDVVAEAEQLAGDGTRELNLVAQDLTYYGRDLEGRSMLVDLLRRLEQVDGIAWIRLMYLYPMYLTGELMDTVAGSRKILPYLDIALQHIDDEVLRRMRRSVTRAKTEELLDQLRASIPRLVLRTTLIAGFPGETEAQFESLLEFVRRRRFERLGVFPFSPEPGTPAMDLDGHLPDEVRQERADRLMATQQEIAFAWNAARVGERFDVLIDSDIPGESTAFVGRTYADAPEIDGVVYVTGERLRPGEIVSCEIVATHAYDLVGVAL